MSALVAPAIVAAQLKRKPVSLTTHAARTRFMHKREGRRRYESLVAETKAAIDAADPIGLLEMGAPSSEYEPEIGTIVPRVAKAADVAEVHRIVYQEFVQWFNMDLASPIETYDAVAREIWEAVLRFRRAV